MNFDVNRVISRIIANPYMVRLFRDQETTRKFAIFDIGVFHIKYIVFELNEKIRILDYRTARIIQPGTTQTQESLGKTLGDLIYGKSFEDCNVIVMISGQQVSNRFITLPRIPDEELESAIKFEIKKLMHMEMEKICVKFSVTGTVQEEKGREKLRIFVAVVREEDVNLIEKTFKSLGITLSAITVESLFYISGYEECGLNGTVAFIDIGAENTNFNIVTEGELEFSRNIPMGGNAITELIAKDLSGSPAGFRDFLEEAEFEKKKNNLLIEEADLEKMDGRKKISVMSLSDGVSRIIQRIRLTIGYFKTQVKGKNIDAAYILGGSSNIAGTEDFFSRNIDIQSKIVSFPPGSIDYAEESVKKRVEESWNYSWLLVAGALYIKKHGSVLNFISRHGTEKVTWEELLDNFPEPKTIFTIAAAMLLLFYSVIWTKNRVSLGSEFGKYISVKENIAEYRKIEDEIKWTLKSRKANYEGAGLWISGFRNERTDWNIFFDFIGKNLPEKAVTDSVTIVPEFTSQKLRNKLNVEFSFEDEEEYKNFKFFLENVQNWPPRMKPDRVTLSDRIQREGDVNVIKLSMEALLN